MGPRAQTYLCLAGAVIGLAWVGPAHSAEAEEGFVLAMSAAQHLRVLADGGSDWCKPGLRLRMVLDPDSPALRDPTQQDAMLNRLGALIGRSCPEAVWAEVAVQANGNLLSTRSLDKSKGWALQAQAVQAPMASAAPAAASPIRSAPPASQEERRLMYGLKPGSEAAINQILTAQHKGGQPAQAARQAMDRLWAEGLDRPPAASQPDPLSNQLTSALKSGPPSPALMPGLADVYNKLTAPKDVQRAALVGLLKQAGRPIPPDDELNDRLKAAAQVRDNRQSPSQHVTVRAPGGLVRVDHSPTGGGSAISVVQNGPNGQPMRETFSGQEAATPTADGTGLQTAIQPDPPREMTQAQSDSALAGISGSWIDQDGNFWDISDPGKGTDLVATETNRSGHKLAYKSSWMLGLMDGTHVVDDVLDMDDELPMDVRQQLASSFHPPFAIKLEYLPKEDALQGQWISGTVTYSGLSHAVKVVDDPTWDKPLKLTRPPPPPHYFLFAHTATGRQNIDKFYQGVATDIEAQFDKPYAHDSINIDISAGGQKITLAASRVDPKGYIFRTAAFLPGAPKANKDEMWGSTPRTQGRQ
jgi:hypothetical protein